MKNTRPLIVLIVLLIIWNIILTVIIVNNKKTSSTEETKEVTIVGFSTDFTSVVSNNKSSIVTIDADGTISSGYIYKQDNDIAYILTTYHGVADGHNIEVIFDNSYRGNGEIKGYDIYADLCVIALATPYDLKPLTSGNSELLKAGEFVISIGTPISLAYKNSIELGMISSKLRTIENSIIFDKEEYKYFTDVIQLTSLLKAGYSGSPLLNMNGEVVGISTMAKEDGLTFAFPINEAKIIADKIINNEEYRKLQLGIDGLYLTDLENYEKTSLNIPIDVVDGLYISHILEDNLASIYGLKTGDVITTINGQLIKNHDDYLSIVYSNVNDFTFSIIRNGESMEIKGSINND